MNESNSSPADDTLVFLKLGGSLITKKSRTRTARRDVIRRIAGEIAAARAERPRLQIVLGHGSGSFGHHSGQEYGTRAGVSSREDWHGFSAVWFDASRLNHIVMDALHQHQLPALSFPPSASATLDGKDVRTWQLAPLQKALEHRLLPVVYGDVLFDSQLGGTILSTEEIFHFLAQALHPTQILLAGQEPGVWNRYPQKDHILSSITPHTYPRLADELQASETTDVTGGMASKVEAMLSVVETSANLEAWIFSGLDDGSVYAALTGQIQGTRIHS